jgi:ribosomal protein S18 acetylase RimI-like enzyme
VSWTHWICCGFPPDRSRSWVPCWKPPTSTPSTLKRSGSSSTKSAPTSPPAGGARSGYALESAQISAAIRVPCPPLHEGPGWYAHKVTVDRAYGGQGLGAELLDWAGTKAADEGAGWLRVDVWTTNERLQHYYLRQGFTYVRTVVLPHNPSGALFQRPAQHVPTPRLHEDRAAAEPPPRS